MKTKAILLLISVAACAQAQYKVVFLPTESGEGWALGAGGGQIVGTGFFQGGGPLLWEGPLFDQYISLRPPGFQGAEVLGVNEGRQVGWGMRLDGGNDALMWAGSAESVVDLNPIGYNTLARATDGKSQVGDGGRAGSGEAHAVMWRGTAASFVDLHPPGYDTSGAYGVWGDVQVGQLEGYYACLWRGTPGSMRRLPSPEPRLGSGAFSVHGDQIAGYSTGMSTIWNANTLRWTFLGPGFALATNGIYQVGVSRIGVGADGPFGNQRATRWSSRPGSGLDLQQFVPLDFVEESVAYGIDENGVIVGYVDSGPDVFPVAWVPVGGG